MPSSATATSTRRSSRIAHDPAVPLIDMIQVASLSINPKNRYSGTCWRNGPRWPATPNTARPGWTTTWSKTP
ncbi:MAG: hypothetical protein LBK99_23485 [Opitutaceae bacterium]|nr:hypothetical protein [Opitutaceae bacterium]